MKKISLLAALLVYGCSTEPNETPRIELWSHVSSESLYILSVSSKVSSQTFTDTLLMASSRFYSNFSVTCTQGYGIVQVLGANGAVLKQFSFQADVVTPGRAYIDTLALVAPKKVLVTFQDYSGILTYELRGVQ